MKICLFGNHPTSSNNLSNGILRLHNDWDIKDFGLLSPENITPEHHKIMLDSTLCYIESTVWGTLPDKIRNKILQKTVVIERNLWYIPDHNFNNAQSVVFIDSVMLNNGLTTNPKDKYFHISNGVDCEFWKSTSRHKRTRILFVAHDTHLPKYWTRHSFKRIHTIEHLSNTLPIEFYGRNSPLGAKTPEELRNLYSEGLAYICPHRISVTVMEAMACGCPVLSLRDNENFQALSTNKTLWKYSFNTDKELILFCNNELKKESVLQSISDEFMSVANRDFSIINMASKYLEAGYVLLNEKQ